jgi:hypothetical protein
MASAFDDLLGNLVNKLKSAGVGSKTAAQKRAEIDYLTPSNIAAQAGQGTVSGPAEFYDMSRRTDYTYKPREYDKTIPMNRGMLSGDGLGLAAPATSYSSDPASTTDRRSTGRGMYGMGTTPEDGFSMGLFDAATLANQQPTDNYGVTTVTDPDTGKEFVIDGYGRSFEMKPESQTTIDYNAEGGLGDMFKNVFASADGPVVLDTGTSLQTGVGVVRDLEGSPLTFIAEGIGGMLSDMDARANPGNVRDQTVRARRADNARDVAEEKIRIEQMMMQGAIASGLTPREAQRQVKSQQGQRRVEEEQLKRKQERDIALANAENLGYDQEEMDLEIQRLSNKAPKKEKKEQGIFDKLMNLFVSPVYGSDNIETAETQFDDFGNVVNASTSRFISPVAAQSDQLFSGHLNRFGGDSPEARSRLTELASKVAMIESDGDMKAKNPDSSATGLYQFLVDDSKGQSALQTAVNRTKKYVKADWLDEVARTGKVEDLSPEKQTILFFGDIMEKKGSDQYLKKLLDPNASEKQINDAMMDIYLNLHHTNPDKATLERAKKFIK